MYLPLFVINPNSNSHVTAGIDSALQPLRLANGPAIHAMTIEQGPSAVQTQQDMAAVTILLSRLVAEKQAQAGAFVIACFSDPGLAAVREITQRPVFGIGECAVLTAMTLGQQFGVIAMQRSALGRHLRTYGAMGVMDRFAGELAVDLSMEQLGDPDVTFKRLLAVGRQLRDQNQADVLIMGCAGMAVYRQALQHELGVPVVEPCQAGAAMALTAILLNGESVQ
ncbi:aspartate/glutamate racemase family protein [Pseudomonas quasicaspiana]|uniref:aspartate/glutamate racemase family protein n=1 Tax=Pseudomonas quasicaspiana TaxID=2829821 RepID=UPI001E5E5513|nr:aspartate/glutamate racemase family protein [Pseudomonas quasicaspiana]MCD5976050.1 aspartate/glutamate racemase family protein [Pseudomonas quasicaspiana]